MKEWSRTKVTAKDLYVYDEQKLYYAKHTEHTTYYGAANTRTERS
jgi:hypothetical protein